MLRKIIQIDEEKCIGCRLCVDACHEGAIGMVDGKARLLRDDYCDGLGDCLPACPTEAITFVEREAAPYDEAAVEAHLAARASAEASAEDILDAAVVACGMPRQRRPHPGPQRLSWQRRPYPGCARCDRNRPGRRCPAEPARPVAGADQARARERSLLPGTRPAHRRRLHGVRLRQLPRALHERQCHHHRVPQARRGQLH